MLCCVDSVSKWEIVEVVNLIADLDRGQPLEKYHVGGTARPNYSRS